MSAPLISVITPVGPRHTRHARVANASVRWQTLPRSWVEHLLVADTAKRGPAVARNVGIAAARGAFLVFLDADDYLIPEALETYLRGYVGSHSCYVYADNYVLNGDGSHHLSSSQEYSQQRMGMYNQHVVTALAPADLVRAVGGFDTKVDAWEDWTLWLRFAIAGYCGERIPAPALVYRIGEGDRMTRFLADQAGNVERMALVTRRYTNNKGVIEMAPCGGCGGGHSAELRVLAQQAVAALPESPLPSGAVRLQYVGAQQGSFVRRSPYTGQTYKLAHGRLVDVPAEFVAVDVPWLESFRTGDQPTVRRVPPAAPFRPPPIYDPQADVSLSDLDADAVLETV
jgi:hypothetical protein